MRFLADECCDFAAVRALRVHGHDVLAVSEFQQLSVDQDVMGLRWPKTGYSWGQSSSASRPGGRLRARAPAPHGLSGRRPPGNQLEPPRRRPTLYYYFNDL